MEEPFRRKFIKNVAFPHGSKIHRSLYFIMAISESYFKIEEYLKEKQKLPKQSGFVVQYPSSRQIEENYAVLLLELLTEVAVFIRGHDDYWKHKDGQGWSAILKRGCGHFSEKDNDNKKVLTLRMACNKIIHHDSYDLGYVGTNEKFTFFFCGKQQEKQWRAELDVTEFCMMGLLYIR